MQYLGAVNYYFEDGAPGYGVSMYHSLFVPVFTLVSAYITGENMDAVMCLISEEDQRELEYLRLLAADFGITYSPLQLFEFLEEHATEKFMHKTASILKERYEQVKEDFQKIGDLAIEDQVRQLQSYMRSPWHMMWMESVYIRNSRPQPFRSTLSKEFAYLTFANIDAEGEEVARYWNLEVPSITKKLDRCNINSYTDFVLEVMDIAIKSGFDVNPARRAVECALVKFAFFNKIPFTNGIHHFIRKVVECDEAKSTSSSNKR